MIKFDFLDKFVPEEEGRKAFKPSQNEWEFEKYAEWIQKEFKHKNKMHYLEIGSYAGESLYYMSQIMPEKSIVTLVDLPLNKSARKVLVERVAPWCAKKYGHVINLITGDTRNPESAEKTRAFIPFNSKYDLCFIDANHEFDYTLNDFVKFRGLADWISFHDISKFNTWKTKVKFNVTQANANHLWEAIKVMVPQCEIGMHNDEIAIDNWLEFIAYDDEPEPKESWGQIKPRGIGVLRSQW